LAHPKPQLKWHLDWFSRFCTDPYTLQWAAPSALKIAPSMRDLDPHLIVLNPNGISIGWAVLQGSLLRQTDRLCCSVDNNWPHLRL